MKLVILAGGRGTRISEETLLRPKPLVEIGGLPIIWHIMKIYSTFGFNEFVICCGYKGYMIKEYFSNYGLHTSDTTIDLSNKTIKVHKKTTEKWKITLIDTGEETMTGGRILRIKDYVGENFCLTYGDGLANVNIKKLIKFHKTKKKIGTVMLSIGFLFSIYLGVDKIFIDTSGRLITERPEFYIALATMIMGSQFFLAGFWVR